MKISSKTTKSFKIIIYSLKTFVAGFGAILFCATAIAQEIPQQMTIASSPNPVGSGARAMGMGGAFIAVADDATAASWNPAGLSQLKRPEFSFAFSYFSRREDFGSSNHPEASGVQKSINRELNYFSLTYPFELFDRNMIISLHYQQLYDFERDLNSDYTIQSNTPFISGFSKTVQKIDFEQRGTLKAISPAYAVEITPSLSFGITFNIWTDELFWSNGWESRNVVKGSINSFTGLPVRFKTEDNDRYHDFRGFNMHLGLLWKANRFLTFGAVVKTPFTADIKHERIIKTRMNTALWRVSRNKVKIKENVDLDMPISFGLGMAVRFSDRFTMSFDLYRTDWSDFILEDGEGRRISPITGMTSHQSHIHSTTQVRLGAEYLFILSKTIIPLRLGFFYDPEPSAKNPDDYWGFSLGTGASLKDIVIDFAYQFRFGRDVEGEVLDIPSTKADVTQHLFLVSTILYF